MMRLRAAILIILVFISVTVAQETVNGPEGDCEFSKFRPRMISDFVRGSAISQKEPDYPPAAKAGGLDGEVRVRILINKRGLVEKTCPVFVKGSPRPSRTLVIAAEAAALQWTFEPNFGVSPGNGIRFDYVQDTLIFRFVLPKQ